MHDLSGRSDEQQPAQSRASGRASDETWRAHRQHSWGCYSTGCTWKTGAFNRPDVTYLAASGDLAYGSYPPAQFANVISVGGTVLAKSGSHYSETVWRDTSGACAPNIAKPAWEHDPGCSQRTANDIAAVSFNVAEYDSYSYGGWVRAEGTSAATPLLASAFALAGSVTKHYTGELFWTLPKKQLKKDLHAIDSGSNGCPASLQGSYHCTAGTGQFGTYSRADRLGDAERHRRVLVARVPEPACHCCGGEGRRAWSQVSAVARGERLPPRTRPERTPSSAVHSPHAPSVRQRGEKSLSGWRDGVRSLRTVVVG